MVRCDHAMDLFTDSYAALLAEVKQDMDADRRTEQVVKMKMMLMVQSGFVLNEHIKYQKMIQGPYSTRGGNA